MIVKKDTISCQCGNSFEWKTFFQEKSTADFFKWDDVQANVLNKSITNNQYIITAQCPICKKKHYILLDK